MFHFIFHSGYEGNFDKYDATVIQSLGAQYDYGKKIVVISFL